MSQDWNDWYYVKPNKDTYVLAKYSLSDSDWIVVKTCGRGCCVYDGFDSMITPNFWKPATSKDAEALNDFWERQARQREIEKGNP